MQKKNEKKSNKKVVVVAAMALLLALVGISGGETYAKYASSQKDSATATVAKWGYTVTANAKELFGKQYGTATNATAINGSGVNVVSRSSNNVVAPGTEGSMTMKVAGDAEVLSQIVTKIKVTDIVLITDKNENDPYYPLDWTLTVTSEKGSETITDTDLDRKYKGATFEAELNSDLAKINEYYAEISANTTVNYSITLAWKWSFDSENDVNDLYDTVFGGLVNKVPAFKDDGTANWGNSNKSYIYQNSEATNQEVTYTDAGSVFQTAVSGSVVVSQIQKSAPQLS